MDPFNKIPLVHVMANVLPNIYMSKQIITALRLNAILCFQFQHRIGHHLQIKSQYQYLTVKRVYLKQFFDDFFVFFIAHCGNIMLPVSGQR